MKIKILLVIFIIFMMTLSINADDTLNNNSVEIAAYNDDGFYIIKDGEVVGGYAYDLLAALNRYLEWDVSYDINSWKLSLDKVKDNEADLVFGVFKTDERLQDYVFNNTPIAIVTNYLYGNPKTKSLNGNFSLLEGSKIGVTEGSSSINDFLELLKSYNVKVELVNLASYQEIEEKMLAGEIDYFLDNTVMVNNNFCVVQKLNTKPMYIMGPKGSEDILQEFDDAIERLNYVNPVLTSQLLFKSYKNENNIYSNLSNEDFEDIEKMKPLELGVLNNNLPNYYFDKSDKGVISGVVEQIYEMSGLKINLVRFDNEEDMIASFNSNKIDMMSGVAYNFYAATKNDYNITMPYLNDEVSIVLPKTNVTVKNSKTIAILKTSLGFEEELANFYPDYQAVIYDDLNKFLKAIISGEVEKGIAINLSFQANIDEQPLIKDVLSTTDTTLTLSSSIAINRYLDTKYLEIMDKSITNLNENYIKDDVISSIDYLRDNNQKSFIEANINKIIIGFLLILLLIILLLLINLNSRRRNKILFSINEELEKTKKELIIANEEKSDFLARMSHDMRTPMNAIISVAEFGYEENDDPINKDYYSQIKSSGDYLLSIMNDLLETRVIQMENLTLKPTLVNIHDAIEEITNVSKFKVLSKKIEFRNIANIEKDIEYVYADVKRIKQVIINIIDNAIKYTPIGGSIKWTVNVEKIGNKLKVVHIIEDNGYGMSKDFQKDMYEPFQREFNDKTQSIPGTGLGLAISKAIIDKMNGSIECESQLDKGTKFTITFNQSVPTVEDIDNYLHTTNIDLAAISYNGEKILVVEDNEINIKIITKILAKFNFEVVIKRNGLEAVEYLKTKPLIDYCLMDIRMPVMDGLEATKLIRTFNKELPIIALSANAFQEDIDKAIKAGVNAHLAKPLDKQKLLTTLNTFREVKKGSKH